MNNKPEYAGWVIVTLFASACLWLVLAIAETSKCVKSGGRWIDQQCVITKPVFMYTVPVGEQWKPED